MQKKYVDLEMSSVTVNNDAIVSQTSSISRTVSQKKQSCDEACTQYGWVAGITLFTTGLIIGGGYLIKLLATE